MRDHLHIAQQSPAAPLSCEEMVPDEVLRELASGGPERQRGELSAEHRTILASYLPEIMGELLAHRTVNRVVAA